MILVVLATPASSQVGEEIQTKNACSFLGDAIPDSLHTFDSNQEALSVVQQIVSSSGLVQNFKVLAAGVPNAAADINGTTRLILYNPYFMRDVRAQVGGNKWGPISIMAHEVGHHLNGHTLDKVGSRPKEELEADFFSGFILQRMGSSLDDARAAMEKLGSSTPSSTHPAKSDRLVAIASGWEKSCANDAACSGLDPKPLPAPRPKPASKRDSCEYAKDGECDEPELCERGTDATDCSQVRVPQPGPEPEPVRNALPNYCCTPVGKLGPYPNPGVPEGGPCYGTHPFFGMQHGRACF
jgi:hypothetical protein